VALSDVPLRAGRHACRVNFASGRWGLCGIAPTGTVFVSGEPYECPRLFGWACGPILYPTSKTDPTCYAARIPETIALDFRTGDDVDFVLDLSTSQLHAFIRQSGKYSCMPVPKISEGWVVVVSVYRPAGDRLVLQPLRVNEVHATLLRAVTTAGSMTTVVKSASKR